MKRKQEAQQQKKLLHQKSSINNGNENRSPLKQSLIYPQQLNQPSLVAKPLTCQQKEEIEKKRLQALERAKANNLISEQTAAKLAIERKISAEPSSSTENTRISYLKPQNESSSVAAVSLPVISVNLGKAPAHSSNSIVANRSHPYHQVGTKATKLTVTCTIEFITEQRFVVRTGYNEAVINEFRKISSRNYGKLNLH